MVYRLAIQADQQDHFHITVKFSGNELTLQGQNSVLKARVWLWKMFTQIFRETQYPVKVTHYTVATTLLQLKHAQSN